MKKTTLFFVAAFVATMFFNGIVDAKSKENTSKYMIIDIQNGNVEYSNYEPLGGWTDTYKTTKLVMRRINSGNFLMGSPESELGRSRNETQHNVTITLPFYISVFEITQSQYQLITGYNPSRLKGNTRPVDNVSYDEINSYFLNKIREKIGLNFDLPTEAQWEYACRAGTTNAWNNGSDIVNTDQDKELNKLGRYKYNQNDLKGDCSEHTTVGSYLPNAWGLYDMHGNVWEWCLDWYGDIEKKPATNPSGPGYGTYRVLRGGSWDTEANNCRSAMRNMYPPNKSDANLGFRIVIINKKTENGSSTNPMPGYVHVPDPKPKPKPKPINITYIWNKIIEIIDVWPPNDPSEDKDDQSEHKDDKREDDCFSCPVPRKGQEFSLLDYLLKWILSRLKQLQGDAEALFRFLCRLGIFALGIIVVLIVFLLSNHKIIYFPLLVLIIYFLWCWFTTKPAY